MEDATLTWYREHLTEFVARTADVDMTPHYEAFLAHMPPGGSILDLGCGAGSATLFFAKRGYRVTPVDGCRELCEFTAQRTGCPARQMMFQDLSDENAYDGVWACASLLHVRRADMPDMLRRVRRALKAGGVFYASFKYGEGERGRDGRFFTDYTEESLRAELGAVGGLKVFRLWVTRDVRPDRAEEKWVNVLCRKAEDEAPCEPDGI